MSALYRLAWPLLRLVSPEATHGLALWALKTGLVRGRIGDDDAVLSSKVWGRRFANPIGLAAGFDKNAEAVDVLLGLGFGFVEAGTVTPKPQAGNPRPRLFRLSEDGAVINRLGFNNQGLSAFAQRLAARRGQGIVGANLGINRDSIEPADDYAAGIAACARRADYLVINISSPNTPGLRDLHASGPLSELLKAAMAARDEAVAGSERKTPLLLKISPDLKPDQCAAVAGIALDSGIDGLVATNTTEARPQEIQSPHRLESGGLSGRPLFALSTRMLSDLYRLTGGKLPLIGVGGVSSGHDAYVKIRAGASLVQLYTALIYHGPGLVARIKADLAQCLREDGFDSVASAVGADHR